MSIGPWFKCYPDAFIGGLVGLDCDETAFYLHLVLRMYDSADAIYADDKTIARWCSSNVRKWKRVKAGLIEKGKLCELPNGALINGRALAEMVQVAGERESLPDKIRDRLAELSRMFGESFGKDSRKIRETCPETPTKSEPLRETRSEKLEGDANASPPRKKSPQPKSSARGKRIPNNWSPSPADYAFAAERGFSPKEINDEADQFRDYWSSETGRGSTKLDWSATWRNRIRNQEKYRARFASSRGNNKSKSGGQSGSGTIAAAVLRTYGGMDDGGQPVPERGVDSGGGVYGEDTAGSGHRADHEHRQLTLIAGKR